MMRMRLQLSIIFSNAKRLRREASVVAAFIFTGERHRLMMSFDRLSVA